MIMNSINTDTISSDHVSDWSEFDWKSINRIVVNLRRRIFKATKSKNLRSLRALQNLMLNSASNVAYSVRHVSYNTGSRTPGIDGRLIKLPKERFEIYEEILNLSFADYHPSAVRRIYIKEGTKVRPIGIPTIFDRIVQMIVKNALEPEWEALFEKSSYGFRPKRSVNDAVNRIWITCNRKNGRQWVVDADISKCFDTTSHSYILQKIHHFPAVHVIKRWLGCGIISNDIWFDTDGEGTPQGNIISPLLCNISLHGLEEELGVRYNPSGFTRPDSPVFIRYADDIVIFCRTLDEAKQQLSKLTLALLKRSQTISQAKTEIVHICDGFDFLGFNFKIKPRDGRSTNVIVKEEVGYRYNYTDIGFYVTPSEKSINKIKAKLKGCFAKMRGRSASDLILEINPIIRGWAQSKIFWHSNRTFHDLDNYLFTLQWRWIKRTHPNKNSKWLKERYFTKLKLGYIENNWVFFSKDQSNNKELYLLHFGWFPPKNYVLAKMDKCPDNPDDQKYYKRLDRQRLYTRGFNIFRRIDSDLAESQESICPICNQSLYNEEDIQLHHIIPIRDGGTSSFSNLVLLHKPCHHQAHSKNNFLKFKDYLIQFKQSHPNIREQNKRLEKKLEKINLDIL